MAAADDNDADDLGLIGDVALDDGQLGNLGCHRSAACPPGRALGPWALPGPWQGPGPRG